MKVGLRFPPASLPATIPELRAEVRAFISAELGHIPAVQRANSWARFDAAFSQKLGERGWIGMNFPKRYGGHERSLLERYVVVEELLAAGAPVGAHWIADRQSAHNILHHGSESVRSKWLPKVFRGEAFCAIGMSEPNSGSDLASVRTRAARVDGGWKISGQKIWTSEAHKAQIMIALVRTSDPGEQRHNGLSQFVIELNSPGVVVRPIPDLTGEVHFNEVFLNDVFVPEEALLGKEGDGWKLVTSELALERSGPERYLSSFALYVEFIRVVGPNPAGVLRSLIGRIAAHLWTLRQMSLFVASALAEGKDPAVEAVMVKDLGNSFEQNIPSWIQAAVDAGIALEDDSEFATALAYLLQVSPSFSLRGGTREILRDIIARNLGLR
jgi:alkylation response protein AidB-like acyl-CoA dehydrogenase